MLQRVIHGSIQYRIIVLLITAGIAVFGIHAFQRTPIEAFPDVTNLQVNVIAQAPGLAPEEMELQVTIPLERALNGIPHASMMRSESLFGLSLIWIVFEDNADGFKARTHVMERLMEADLPDNTTVELAPDYTPLGKILYYRLKSDTRTLTDLRSLQETTIERSLRQVQGVADVIGIGGYLKEIHVEIVPEQLHAHKLTLLHVIDRLEHSNMNAGGGFMRHGDQEFVIRSIGRIEDAEDIRSIVLESHGGATVTLGDVANIYQSYTPRRGGASVDYDDEVVEGIVLMRRKENPNDLLDKLHKKIDKLNQDELPDDVQLEVLYDRGDMVGRTLHTVYNNLFHGAVLVIAVCWLMLRILRGSLTVAIVIPVSLITAFTGLYFLKLPANLISMGAIDFGIIVDGAVVLVENVQKHIHRRRPPTKEALREVVAHAALEVARPTFFAMSIIIAAMLPIFSLESVEGRIFRPLALTYVFALIGALVASLTLVPALASMSFRVQDADVHEFRFIHALERGYQELLTRFSIHKWVVAVLAALLLITSGWTSTKIGTEFLPELDEGDIYIFAEAPASISLSSAAKRFNDVRRTLMEFPEVMHVLSEQGRPEDGTDNEGVNLTKLFVRLHPSETWTTGRNKEQLVDAIRDVLAQYPGISFNFSQPIKDSVEEAVSGVRGEAVLKVYGRDYTSMRAYLVNAIDALQHVEGITDLDLYRDTVVPQLQVELDRTALARHGILVEDAQTVITTALAGTVATTYFEDELPIPVRVRTPLEDREDEGAIGNILIPAPSGMFVPLRELADIHMGHGRSTIPHEDNVRYLALKFNIEGRASGTVINEAISTVDANVELPEGLRIQWGGEFENQQRAMARLQIVVPIALLIVLVLLIAAMRSVPLALIIMLVIPVALSGGMYGLAAIQEELSVSAAIGFIALVGQISLLGLIMLSHLSTDPRTAPNIGTREAIPHVAAEKFRALLTAALLSSLGLLPMALSTAMGSETQRPFAAVIVFGMITTLAVAIFVIPLLYGAWVFRKQPRSALAQAHPAGAVLMCVAMIGANHLVWTPSVLAQASSNFPDDHPVSMGFTDARTHISPTDLQPIAGDFETIARLLSTNELWQDYASAQVDAAEAARTTARALEDPSFSYEIEGFTGHGTDFVDGSHHSFLLEWELPLQRIRAFQSKVVDAEVARVRASFRKQHAELAVYLMEAWAEVETEHLRMRTLEQAIERVSKVLTIVEKRVERGVSPKYDALSLETYVARLQRQLETSSQQLFTHAVFISRMLQLNRQVLLPHDAWAPPTPDTMRAFFADISPPEIDEKHAESKHAEAEAQLARKHRVPTIVLSGGLQLATREPGRAALGGVSVRLPLFGARKGAVQQADATLHQSQVELRWTEAQFRAEQERLLQTWSNRFDALQQHDQNILTRTTELEILAQKSYLGGQIGYAEFIDAIQAHIETDLERVDLIQELLETYVALQKWGIE